MKPAYAARFKCEIFELRIGDHVVQCNREQAERAYSHLGFVLDKWDV